MVIKKHSPNPVDIYVGARFRQLRTVHGLTQEQIANKLGLPFQQIQKYEKGTNRISASRLYQISKILDVQPNHFFVGYETREDENSTVIFFKEDTRRKIGIIAAKMQTHTKAEQKFLFDTFKGLSDGIKGALPPAIDVQRQKKQRTFG